MKKIFRRSLSVFLLLCLCGSLLAANVSAHEIYYTGSFPNYTGISLVWNERRRVRHIVKQTDICFTAGIIRLLSTHGPMPAAA